MAVLEKILIENFRNIELAELSFCPGVNCICGDNGQGKTNLLDAIYYLSMTKSALGIPDSYCIRDGEAGLSVAGTFRMQDGISSRFVISMKDSAKVLRRDDKVCPSLAEHIGRLPVVMVSPKDAALVSESGELRRRFANSVLSQMKPGYLAAVQQYTRILAQRNHLLKSQTVDLTLLDALDAAMDPVAAVIYSARKEFVSNLRPVVADFHSALSGSSEKVDISYSSDLSSGTDISGILRSSRDKDIAFRFTTSGLQRDDFIFTIDGRPLRRCGSQGQQKSFLVAVKLAQYNIMKAAIGNPPILLLDDVFDKLDEGRISNLLSIVSGDGYGQIFISDTSRLRLERIMNGIAPDTKFFVAQSGTFKNDSI